MYTNYIFTNSNLQTLLKHHFRLRLSKIVSVKKGTPGQGKDRTRGKVRNIESERKTKTTKNPSWELLPGGSDENTYAIGRMPRILTGQNTGQTCKAINNLNACDVLYC